MAVPSLIDFRDLNQYLEVHRVVVSPPSDTTTQVWGRVYPTSSTQADIVIHNGWAFDQFANDDWQQWYFDYAGHIWYVEQFDIIDGGRLVQLEVSTTAPSGSSSYNTYNDDAAAAAGGVSVGGIYIAGSGHERADIGGLTTRLS